MSVIRVTAAAVLLIGCESKPDRDPNSVQIALTDCQKCAIERTVVAVIGGDTVAQQEAPLGVAGAIWLSGRNQFLAVGMRPLGGPLLFSADGRFDRTIGRPGRGPGEYVGAAFVLAWRGDSVLVVDPPLSRISVLTPSLDFARSFPLMTPYVDNAVVLPSGRIVISGPPSAIGQDLYPIRVVDHAGDPVGPVGGSVGQRDVARGRNAPYLLASDNGSIWIAPSVGEYALEEWDGTTLHLRRRLIGDRTRIERWPVGPPTPERPPEPRITGMYVDGNHLWVLVVVADHGWSRGLGAPVPGEGGALRYPVEDVHQVYDTVVDVFDVRAGRLLASRRFDEFAYSLLSSGGLATIQRESSGGELFTELVRFRVTGEPN